MRDGVKLRTTAALALAALLAGCAAAGPFTPLRRGAPDRTDDLLVPPGHGSLLQDQITLELRTDSVQLKVTPLEEWVVRLTAPDTYARLSGLAATYRAEIASRTGDEAPALFLVSFFARTPGAAFTPEDVQLVHRGRRLRPAFIRPMTTGWEHRRLEAGETQTAIYSFSEEIDLQQPLALEYGDATGSAWEDILDRLEAERTRARGRAGVGGA
jgi:hypothetical protein